MHRAAPLAPALLAAADVIAGVIGGRRLDASLASTGSTGIIRAAAQDLAYGALRACGRGDFFLARLVSQPLRDARIRGLLLAALHRLEVRPGEAHTTVDQAVVAAAALASGRYKGLVNGVLRNFLRRREELTTAAVADAAARFQHPRWWLDQLQAAYPQTWQQIAEAGNSHPPMTLRVNRRRLSADAYLAELQTAAIEARLIDGTAIQLARPLPVDRLPGFAEGRVSVQDWGAQQAAALLDAQPGMRLLDACAAPGGKTAHLLEHGDYRLTAIEADEVRSRRIGENLGRLDLQATVQIADCRDLAAWWDGEAFARILADVPCSASGVVRRHPDIKWLRRPGDLAGFVSGQAEILDALWHVLAPGGKMLYATCSLFPEENGQQMEAFVARHPDAQRLPTGGARNDWQLTPDADHDGFYYALLAKR